MVGPFKMACFGLRSLRWTPARVERHYSACTNLLDLPLCVLEEIVDCVIAPFQHVGTEAKLENFADACHALRALLLTHPLFLKVVTKDIWRKALELNWPRVQTTWDLIPRDSFVVLQWKEDVFSLRQARGDPLETGPPWSAPICEAHK